VIRVCLDSNVLVAAFAARGLCSDVLAHVLSEQHLVVPDAVREETQRILKGKFRLSSEALASVVAVLDRCEAAGASREPSPVQVRDPDDERILADAVGAGVQIMVTGDKDLLDVAEQSPIPILSPRAFLMLTRGGAL
jgi:putative PIN family toxin of toxin-antitoxin system